MKEGQCYFPGAVYETDGRSFVVMGGPKYGYEWPRIAAMLPTGQKTTIISVVNPSPSQGIETQYHKGRLFMECPTADTAWNMEWNLRGALVRGNQEYLKQYAPAEMYATGIAAMGMIGTGVYMCHNGIEWQQSYAAAIFAALALYAPGVIGLRHMMRKEESHDDPVMPRTVVSTIVKCHKAVLHPHRLVKSYP